MAISGTGVESNPYIVHSWSEFMACPTTSQDPIYTNIVYIKWELAAGETNKYIDSITITELPSRYVQQIDFNGFTFGTVTVVKTFEADPVCPSNCFINGYWRPWENIDGCSCYKNLTINELIIPDPRISLTRNRNIWHNCYIHVTINSELDTSSTYWSYAIGYNGESLCPFGRDAQIDESIIWIKSRDVSTRVPICTLTNSELYIDYKWTLNTSMGYKGVIPRGHMQTETEESAHGSGGAHDPHQEIYRMRSLCSYIGGTFEMQGGSYTYIMRPRMTGEQLTGDTDYYGIIGKFDMMTTDFRCIINIKFILANSSQYIQVQEPLFGIKRGSSLYRYQTNLCVINNGISVNQWRGQTGSASFCKITTGDLKNPTVLTEKGIDYIEDDNVRYDQYNTPFNFQLGRGIYTPRTDRKTRQSNTVNHGIPFIPFWKYPPTEHWDNYGAVDQNPYICIYDLQTPQDGFTGHGLAILEPSSCRIVHELNGQYNLIMTHPKDPDGKYQYILELNIIKALGQLFVIQRVDEVQRGGSEYISCYAEHISYTLNDRWLLPGETITGTTGTELLEHIYEQSYAHHEWWQTQYYFTMTSDVEVPEYFRDWYEMPDGATPYEMILGSDGFVAKLGGELYRDNFTISINQRMYGAQDNAFEINVGLNLAGIKRTVDLSTFCTYFRAYDVTNGDYDTWFGIAWDERTVSRAYPREVVRTKNFYYEHPEYSEGQLVRDAFAWFNQHCFPRITYEFDIVDLRRNPDYKDFANIFNFRVGDKGKVWDERLRAWAELEITRTEHDAITGDCTKVCVGTELSFTRPASYTPFVPRPNYIIDSDMILEGKPPITFYANGENLSDWEIHGADGGVGTPDVGDNKYNGGYEIAFYDPYTGTKTDDPSTTGYPVDWAASQSLVEVEASTTYCIAPKTTEWFASLMYIIEYDSNGDYVGYHYSIYENYCRFTTASTTKYIRVEIPSENNSHESYGLSDFMLNLGTTPEEYQPYFSGYSIPITVTNPETNESVTVKIWSQALLYSGDSIVYSDDHTDISTYRGTNVLTVGTSVMPTMKITYREV